MGHISRWVKLSLDFAQLTTPQSERIDLYHDHARRLVSVRISYVMLATGEHAEELSLTSAEWRRLRVLLHPERARSYPARVTEKGYGTRV